MATSPPRFARSHAVILGLVLAPCMALAGTGVPADVQGQAVPTERPTLERLLVEGRLSDAEAEQSAILAERPADDNARFGLGLVRFLRAVEGLSQRLYRFGLRPRRAQSLGIPLLRLPIPANIDPEPIHYDDTRRMLEAWVEDLAKAEQTLEPIRDPELKLSLPLGLVRLDLDGDGEATEAESLVAVVSVLDSRVRAVVHEAPELRLTLDVGDAHWLRGYCHLLTALADIVLAYDQTDQFQRTAQLFFPRPGGPFGPLVGGGDEAEIADLVTWVHLFRWPLRDSERLAAALGHLRAMVDQSQQSWMRILQETDDDHEWIPNPHQTGAVPGVAITQEMTEEWQRFLVELKALLEGDRLLGHWRVADGRGINLKRVFLEPTDLDLILWLQGSAAIPYLETGLVSDREVWDRLQGVFRGQFVGFVIWLN